MQRVRPGRTDRGCRSAPSICASPTNNLLYLQGADGTAFRYATRQCQDPGDDVQWALSRLADTNQVWMNHPALKRLRARAAGTAKRHGAA